MDGVTPTSPTVSLTAGKEFLIGPFPSLIYNDASGFMNFTYSGVTTLTVAIFTPSTT